jgi:hypothetical protein
MNNKGAETEVKNSWKQVRVAKQVLNARANSGGNKETTAELLATKYGMEETERLVK